MRTKFYLPFIALALIATSCNSKNEATQESGIRLTNLDQTINPRNDFYQYACSGSFDQLAENNRTQIKGLIEELAKKQSQPGSITQKIGDLYNIAMDSAKLNADWVAPIKEY